MGARWWTAKEMSVPPVAKAWNWVFSAASIEEGRAFLEKEGIIDLAEQVDANALAGALVQSP